MRATTMVWMGFKHVGKRDSPPEVRNLPASESTRWFTEIMQRETMAQRFDVVIARTESDCLLRLGERGGGSAGFATEDFDASKWLDDLESALSEKED